MEDRPIIYVGTDHAGFSLKEKIVSWLADWGYTYTDMGAHQLDEQDDYPDFVRPVASAVAKDPEHRRGVILGGSGQGEAMVANRVSGVRAVVYYGGDEEIIRLSREHNNANILSFGARFVVEDEAKEALKMWLNTPFSDEERHSRRIKKIDAQ